MEIKVVLVVEYEHEQRNWKIKWNNQKQRWITRIQEKAWILSFEPTEQHLTGIIRCKNRTPQDPTTLLRAPKLFGGSLKASKFVWNLPTAMQYYSIT